MGVDHLGSGPWCEDGTCGVCRRAAEDPRYRDLLAADASARGASPGVLEQTVTFANALLRHAADGFRAVPEEEYRRRVEVCEGCEQFAKDKGRCLKCGCGITGTVLAKARWASETCPLGLW